MALTSLISIWEYRTLDELDRLRFFKSWAFSGLLTSLGLTVAVLWGFVKGEDVLWAVPFPAVLTLYLLAVLSASLAHAYLKWQENRP